jgi:hypothetical protein
MLLSPLHKVQRVSVGPEGLQMSFASLEGFKVLEGLIALQGAWRPYCPSRCLEALLPFNIEGLTQKKKKRLQ